MSILAMGVIGRVFGILSSVTAVLIIFFSTKYRNGNHKVLYYVFAVLFPVITLIVFAIKRKEMNGVGMKVCPSCGRKYPREFVTCYQCNVELPEYDEKKPKLYKTLAIVMSVIFAVSTVGSIAVNTVNAIQSVKSFFSEDGEAEGFFGPFDFDDTASPYQRIAVPSENGNKVYYDKKGIAYENADDVVLYSENGVSYTYSNATDRYEGSDGSHTDIYFSYVNSDGWLVVDEEDIYSVNKTNGEYYYDYYYVDDDGEKYYDAEFASWTKDGKLITSDKDWK